MSALISREIIEAIAVGLIADVAIVFAIFLVLA